MNQQRKNEIRDYVIAQYIATGSHLFVSDIAKKFNTNGTGVRNALGPVYFSFEVDDRWTGDNFTGKYVSSPCVEPTKSFLIDTIRQLQQKLIINAKF